MIIYNRLNNWQTHINLSKLYEDYKAWSKKPYSMTSLKNALLECGIKREIGNMRRWIIDGKQLYEHYENNNLISQEDNIDEEIDDNETTNYNLKDLDKVIKKKDEEIEKVIKNKDEEIEKLNKMIEELQKKKNIIIIKSTLDESDFINNIEKN